MNAGLQAHCEPPFQLSQGMVLGCAGRNARISVSCLEAVISLPSPGRASELFPVPVSSSSSVTALNLQTTPFPDLQLVISTFTAVLFCIFSGLQRRGNCLSFIATAFISFHFSLPSTKEHTRETNKEGSRKTKRQITVEREINEQRRTEVREQRR